MELDISNLGIEQRPVTSCTNQMLFQSLNSFYATRLIFSYLTPFELQTIMCRLNKWAYAYICKNQNLSIVYGRASPSVSVLYRPNDNQHVLLKTFNFNSGSASLSEIEAFPGNLSRFRSIEAIDNSIYVVGGFDQSTEQIISFCFKISLDGKLIRQPPMNTPRVAFSLVFLGSCLMVAGGFNNGTLNVCEKFSLSTREWHACPPFNLARCYPILCQFNGDTVYAFGGTDGHTPLNSMEKYDESAKEWKLLPPIYHYAAIRNGGFAHQISMSEIMIFGGKGAVYKQPIQRCFVYNALKEEFAGNTTMEAETFDNVAIHLKHEKLYVLGNCTQFYNCKTKMWSITQ